MAWDSEWDGRSYPPSKPRKAVGGIKAKSQKGGFGESWWAKRWIEVLEGFDIGSRLARGRSYARNGQVLSIAIGPGRVTAQVQGSRPKPYDVAILVKPLSAGDWTKIIDALGRQAYFAAKLLAGEMPRDIEPLFREVGLSLFPAQLGDLTTKCSCPDWSNPCKHIAAAYYLIGEEFDRDPFLLFTLRGLDRDALLSRLGPVDPGPVAPRPAPPEPLNPGLTAFWDGPSSRPDDPFGIVEIPPEAAPLPRRLGAFPFWRGETPFLDTLRPSYATASPRGLDTFLGPATDSSRTEEDAPR